VQPVLLRRADGRYQLIAGERRWRAARQAGLATIPAVVREIGDRDALELALTENLLREDLNPLEAAQGYAALQQNHGLSHEEIAEHLGLDRSTVTNTLRLLRLPPEVQQMIAEGAISAGHARRIRGAISRPGYASGPSENHRRNQGRSRAGVDAAAAGTRRGCRHYDRRSRPHGGGCGADAGAHQALPRGQH